MEDTPYAEVWVEFLPRENGGRSSPVGLDDLGYRPHLRVANGEYLGVEFVDGPERLVQPGESTFATVRFVYAPKVDYGALVEGAQFEVLEGGHTVGRGHVVRR
jgi:translation elongation factor EF-Tu-like GTPase